MMERTTKAWRLAQQMGAGWNLGNTLDSFDLRRGSYLPDHQSLTLENAWFNPTTTQAMLDTVAAAGFHTIRIPVTWYQHMDGTHGWRINPTWMDRVQQVVEMALRTGMMTILNVHHDTGVHGWLHASWRNYQQTNERFRALWQQIAQRFRDYDDQLLLEAFNELLDDDAHWQCPGGACNDVVHQLNQDFVDIVRSSGGHNADRVLLVNTYAASHEDAALDAFAMPRDTVAGCLMAQIHYYSPIDFCFPAEKGQYTATTWRDLNGEQQLADTIARLERTFIQQGVPVIMGEFSCAHKDNLAEQVDWAAHHAAQLNAHAIPFLWWDNGGRLRNGVYRGMGLLDRQACRWRFPAVVHALTGVAPEA